MAACITSLDSGKCLSERINELNAGLLAQQKYRRRCARTPEFAFPKSYDNSRLVKTPTRSALARFACSLRPAPFSCRF